VNSAAQVIKGQGFSPTEAAVSTIMVAGGWWLMAAT
jgi:hypothetical protein